MKFDKALIDKILLALQCIALVAVALYMVHWVMNWLFATRPIVYLDAYVAGQFQRPYTYRALTILIIRGLMIFGMPILTATYFQEYVFMAGFALVFFALCRTLMNNQWLAFIVSLLMPPVICVALYSKFFWVYDFNVI